MVTMVTMVTMVQARERLQQRIAELDRLKATSSSSVEGAALGSEELGVDATITCKVPALTMAVLTTAVLTMKATVTCKLRVPCSVYTMHVHVHVPVHVHVHVRCRCGAARTWSLRT